MSKRKKVKEYAEYIGMDLSGPDRTLLWLAEDALEAPLPQVVYFSIHDNILY